MDGNACRALRLHLGWTQVELGAMMGRFFTTISRWETGDAAIDAWSAEILTLISQGARDPDAVARALAFTKAGQFGFALGTLLAPVVPETLPPPTKRAPRTGPRRR